MRAAWTQPGKFRGGRVEPFGGGGPAAEALPAAGAPWRRLLARSFDAYVSVLTVLAVLSLLARRDPLLADKLAVGVWSAFLLLAAEPLLLRRFGATPGKALLGLRLSGLGGDRPTFFAALIRHVMLLWHGLGLGVPIFSQVQLLRSFLRCRRGVPQPWDAELGYTVRPLGPSRAAAFLLALALVSGAAAAARQWARLPPNRGELSVADFAENFNRQAAYLGWDFHEVLGEDGRWAEAPKLDAYAARGPRLEQLFRSRRGEGHPFDYTVENGRLTAVAFTARGSWDKDANGWMEVPLLGQTEIAAAALLWAQKDAPAPGWERQALLRELAERGVGNYTLRLGGGTVTVSAQTEGFDCAGWTLRPRPDSDGALAAVTVTLSLEG